MEKNKKSVILFGFFLILLVAFAIYARVQPKDGGYTQPSADDIVRLYFTAWNDKNYPDMYSTLSDGFKRIEPTAKNLESFRKYVESQGIETVHVLMVKEISNDGTAAVVDYDVEFKIDGNKKDFSGTFMLKNRQADIIRGWKITNPYGGNVDIS